MEKMKNVEHMCLQMQSHVEVNETAACSADVVLNNGDHDRSATQIPSEKAKTSFNIPCLILPKDQGTLATCLCTNDADSSVHYNAYTSFDNLKSNHVCDPSLPVVERFDKSPFVQNSKNACLNSCPVSDSQSLCALGTSVICDETANEVSVFYICGDCRGKFDTICKLHKHFEFHNSNGSYHYDSKTKTAFPKLDYKCKNVQTDAIAILSSLGCDDKEMKMHTCAENKHAAVDSGVLLEPLKVKIVCIKKNMRKHKRVGKDNLEKYKDQKDKINVKVCKRLQKANLSKMQKNKGHLIQDTVVKLKTMEKTISVTKNCADLDTNGMKYKDDDEEEDDVELDGSICNSNIEDLSFDDKKTVYKKIHHKTTTGNHNIESKSYTALMTGNKTTMKKKYKTANSHSKYECQTCGIKCKSKSALNIHSEEVHLQNSAQNIKQCKWCEETCIGAKIYLEHVRHCDKNESLKCFICNRMFVSKSQVSEHLECHRNPHDLKCRLCSKEFTSEGAIQLHIKRHVRPKNIQCEHCGKSFHYPNELSKHILYCNNERNFNCALCELKFKTKESLKHHMTVHSEERPYVCHICGYAGKKSMYLKRHLRSHTGERPYQCKECGARFAALNGLNRHKKTHTNDKHCICTYCGKSFTNNWNLKTHVRQHTGDKPYKCQQCGKAFRQNVLLKLHSRTHHSHI